MRLRIFAAIGLCLLLAAEPAKEKKPGEKLLGTWKATSIIYNGEEVLGDSVQNLKVTFTADKLSVSGEGAELDRYGKFSYALDPAKAQAIDLKFQIGEDKGARLPGIFKVEGDALQICVILTIGGERPTEFKSEESSNIAVAKFKREK
jgi:uncharacterized protein (TIGR03067 family)